MGKIISLKNVYIKYSKSLLGHLFVVARLIELYKYILYKILGVENCCENLMCSTKLHIQIRAVVSWGAGLLTLFQPEGADYAHHITGSTPGFGNLTKALQISCSGLKNNDSCNEWLTCNFYLFLNLDFFFSFLIS